MENLRPLVAPLLHSGCYSPGLLGPLKRVETSNYYLIYYYYGHKVGFIFTPLIDPPPPNLPPEPVGSSRVVCRKCIAG